jgi:DNA-nicking Smr family endonuclease
MKKLVMFVIVPFIIGGILCYGTAFAEHTGPDKYNNEDLEKFGTPNKNAEETAPNVSDKISNEKKSEDGETQDKEQWCLQGTTINRRISDVKMEIDKIMNKYPDMKWKDINKIELPELYMQERLNMLRQNLREAEGALSDLADEARRKGVPLGWIGCNFE